MDRADPSPLECEAALGIEGGPSASLEDQAAFGIVPPESLRFKSSGKCYGGIPRFLSVRPKTS